MRREQYNCDITYGTNAEFGFDYLRDNGMATRKEEQVQRGHYYAIVDEVDSILIDEARTPLIISGPAVVTYDEQYANFRPQVEALYQVQERLCNRFLSEAAGADRASCARRTAPIRRTARRWSGEIGLLLFRVKMRPAQVRGPAEAAGGAGEPPADEPGRAAAPRRPEEDRALRGEGGAVLRH